LDSGYLSDRKGELLEREEYWGMINKGSGRFYAVRGREGYLKEIDR